MGELIRAFWKFRYIHATNAPWFQELELVSRELLVDDLNLFGILGLKSFEDVDKEVPNDLQDLMVVVVEGHLKIKTYKLCQVTVGVGILCSENWNNSEVIN